MFASDDLAPLLAPGDEGDIGFRQGVVTSWDRDTGANSVNVGGAELVDVPILNTAEAIKLAAGHAVALLRFKSSYFILGRVTLPGSEGFASAAVHFEAGSVDEQDFALNTTWTARASLELAGPAWADEALVFQTCVVTAHNSTGGVAQIGVRPAYDDVEGVITVQDVPNLRWATVSTSQTQRINRTDFDTDPITLECQVAGTPTMVAIPGNVAQVHGFAIFRATS